MSGGVGLDPEPAKFPAHLRDAPDAVFAFCAAIVDATADLACAFKPQIAHFAALGAGVARRYRDHGLFVFFAPADKPRYAGSVVIEHGIGGSRSAAPVAKDVMTYLFDPKKGIEELHKLEEEWGGTAQQRLDAISGP